MTRRCTVMLGAICLLAFLPGCTSSRVPVHGRVTLGNQSIEQGEVRFMPLEEMPPDKPARAPTRVAIVDGEYRVTTAGGLQDGEYRVEIEIRKKTGKKTVIRVRGELVERDETVCISPNEYAGAESPLRYVATPGADGRFDIKLPE